MTNEGTNPWFSHCNFPSYPIFSPGFPRPTTRKNWRSERNCRGQRPVSTGIHDWNGNMIGYEWNWMDIGCVRDREKDKNDREGKNKQQGQNTEKDKKEEKDREKKEREQFLFFLSCCVSFSLFNLNSSSLAFVSSAPSPAKFHKARS